ncbi:MAG: hypothetical protein AAF570_24140 [Bacteroidota bacterium]
MEKSIYASYRGSDCGVTIRSKSLEQTDYFVANCNVNAIAAGYNNDVYLAGGNTIWHYTNDGDLITSKQFDGEQITFTGIATWGDKVWVCYTGDPNGFKVLTLDLKKEVDTGAKFSFYPSSIAAGRNNEAYITSHNLVYRVYTNKVDEEMEFFDETVFYTGIAVFGNLLYASYKGGQRGVTIRDLQSGQQKSSFDVHADISAIAADRDGDIYLSSGNILYRYSPKGKEKNRMVFKDNNSIVYTGVAFNATEPTA